MVETHGYKKLRCTTISWVSHTSAHHSHRPRPNCPRNCPAGLGWRHKVTENFDVGRIYDVDQWKNRCTLLFCRVLGWRHTVTEIFDVPTSNIWCRSMKKSMYITFLACVTPFFIDLRHIFDVRRRFLSPCVSTLTKLCPKHAMYLYNAQDPSVPRKSNTQGI